MKNNPNWTYADHPRLNQKYAVRKSDGAVMIQDKTPYSVKELKILGGPENISPEIHNVKRIFDGEVISYHA